MTAEGFFAICEAPIENTLDHHVASEQQIEAGCRYVDTERRVIGETILQILPLGGWHTR
jgi:hypothetical protein